MNNSALQQVFFGSGQPSAVFSLQDSCCLAQVGQVSPLTLCLCVASLQNRLGIIQEQIESVRANTEEIKETTDRIESSLDSIGDDIQEIGQLGGIVANPKIPEQWYSNAKIYELKGDFGNARRAYLQCLPQMPDKIDAHLDFVQFLKVQEGRVGAREIYLAVSKQNPGIASRVALAALLMPDKQVESLEQIMDDGDIPPPVLYLLANRYSEVTLGSQSLSDKSLELKWLRAFVNSLDSKPYLRYFTNQSTASDWSNDAISRLAALDAETSILENPVKVSMTVPGDPMYILITIMEPTLEIEYRTSPAGEFVSTGFET